ncbi:hypothetical protein BG004_006819 [Podila humilis]|nr:hypothetical protein BG004_006819 [Podila humilis]
MVDTTQSPLAMLVLVTPYTLLYLVNQIFLHGVLDNIHYVFFELIFVIAFRKIFGLPDLSEKLFPAQVQVSTGGHTLSATTTTSSSGATAAAKTLKPAKTTIALDSTTSSSTKKKSKKIVRKQAVVKKKKEQPYAREMAAMETKFFDYINNQEIWELVFEDQESMIQVYQYKERPMCYKIHAVMNNTPAVTFDLLSEITRRVEWDPLCVEAKTIAEIGPGTKIQYVRTKGMWPTASRDTVVLGTVKDLGEGVYCNITTSVEHPGMPERIKEKFVRMETAIAGQIISPDPSSPNRCRLVQVLDADLKGWIPEKVIQMVSTKAVPDGMRNVNKLVPSIEPYAESKIIARVQQLLKEEEARVAAGGDDNNEDEQLEPSIQEEESSELKLSNRQHQHQHQHHQHHHHHQNELLKHGQQHQQQHLSHNKGQLERKKRPSTFRVFWEGMKQNVGMKSGGVGGTEDATSRANKVVAMTLFLAVLGPTLARWRRNRRR